MLNGYRTKVSPRATGGLRTIEMLAALLVFAGTPADALEIRRGAHVTVAAGEVLDEDLYASGETVTIDGIVNGDVVAAGREIRLNGRVSGDLIAAGQAIRIEGEVGDDVRAAGMVLHLGSQASVADHVMGAGFSLEADTGSRVAGELFFSGAQAILAGTVDRAVRVSASAVELAGRIGGNVEARVASRRPAPRVPTMFFPPSRALPAIAPGLTIGDSARLDGELDYTSADEANVAASAVIAGSVAHREPEARPEQTTIAGALRSQWFWFLGCLLLGLILLRVAPAWTRSIADRTQANPLSNLGWGMVAVAVFAAAVVVLLVATGVLAVTTGVLSLGRVLAAVVITGVLGEGVLVTAFWIAVVFLAPIVVGYALGRFVLRRVAPSAADGRLWPLLVGLFVLASLRLVPYLGVLVGVAVALLELGAMWQWGRARLGSGAGGA